MGANLSDEHYIYNYELGDYRYWHQLRAEAMKPGYKITKDIVRFL